MFVGTPVKSVGQRDPLLGYFRTKQRHVFGSTPCFASRKGARTLVGQAGGSRKVRGQRKKPKRKQNPSEASDENFESVEVPLSNFSFIQADGSVDWDRLQTFTSRSWEETQTVIRPITGDAPEEITWTAEDRAPRDIDERLAQQEKAALTLSREELQFPGKYERVTSLGALGILARDVLPAPLDATTRAIREQEQVYVTLTVSLERQGDAFVRGRVHTRFRNEYCDRCAARLEMEIRNSFDVWMAAREDAVPNTEDGDPRTEEAVEPFHPGIEQVDFTKHVREAIWLSIPYRVLCTDREVCRKRMEQMGWQFADKQGEAVIRISNSNRLDEPRILDKDVAAPQNQPERAKGRERLDSMPPKPQSKRLTENFAVETKDMPSLIERNPKAAAALAKLKKRLQRSDNQEVSDGVNRSEETMRKGSDD
jgi:uncharacterized metal-binding protein YceD (DUF177 family)